MSSSPCVAGFFSQLFSGNAIVCNSTFQDFETNSGVAQIQTVIDNADTFYSGSAADDVANTVGDQQESQVSDDVANVTQSISSSTVGQFFTTCPDGNGGIAIPGGPCIDYSYILYGFIGLIVLYFVLVFSSLIPKR